LKTDYWEDRFRVFSALLHSSLENLLVADIGCGTGGFSIYMAQSQARVVFCDYGKVNVEMTTQRLKEASAIDNSFGLVADARYLPFRRNVFDGVVCAEMLEHVGEDRRWKTKDENISEVAKATKELTRVVKIGGFLFVLVPNKVFPLEIHSKVPFGNYMPTRLKAASGRILWRLGLSKLGYIPNNFTEKGLLSFFKDMKVESVGSWTRHIQIPIFKSVVVLALPLFGLYLLATKAYKS